MSGPSGSRKCHVIKSQTEEFEFFLSVDEARKGQIITSVTKGGPADRAGLKDGDRVIQINGNNVEKRNHNEVVAVIRECIQTNEIAFVVVDAAHDPNAKAPAPKKSSSSSDPRPRLCKIKKKNNSFGFFLEAHGDPTPGHFIKKVTKGGAADGTGLRDGDRVVVVGKINVEKQSHAEVVNMIKKSGNKVTLLAIDEEGYQDLKSRNIPITEKMIKSGSTRKSSSSAPKQQPAKTAPAKTSKPSTKQSSKSPDHKDKGKVRVVHVFKHPTKGYGFFLRSKKGSSGEFIGDIDKDGSAEHSGLQNDDRVMAVNGKSIEGMAHADVIGLIKSKQAQVVLVVMDDVAKKHFDEKDNYPTPGDIVRAHPHAVRSVKLVRGPKGYGMFLKMEKGCPFHIFADVEKGGVADEVGLKDGEIVIAVGGSGVLTDTHEQCVQKIKDGGSSVEMIVGSRATADFLLKVGVAICLDLAKEWPTEDEFDVPPLGKPSKPKDEPKPLETSAVAEEVVDGIKERDKHLGMKPRLCHVVRQDGGFGFFLKDDKGHFLINVEKTGPAFKAGVLDYDRIIEINGENAEKWTHNQVVEKIKSSGNEVIFLVVNKEEDKFFQEKGIAITASLLNTSDELADEHKPRTCTLYRSGGSFGFHLMGESGREGQFIKEIAKGGAADVAGLKEGDRIIEVNGANVLGESHEVIVKKVTEKKDEVTFLVIDKEGEAYYKLRSIKIVASLAVVKAVVEETDVERESIGHASAASSVIETEATVHHEDDGDAEGIKAAAAVAAVAAAIDDSEEEEIKSVHEEPEPTVQEVVEEIREVVEEKLDDEEQERMEQAVKAALAEQVVDEVQERIEERVEAASDRGEESDEQEQEEEITPADVAEAIVEVLEENSGDGDSLEPAEKAAIAVVAAAAANEIFENGDDERSESNHSRPSTPEPTREEDNPPVLDQYDVQEAIEERREEDEDEKRIAAKAAAILVHQEIAERISDKGEDSENEEETRIEEREIRPPSPVQAPPSPPPPVREPEPPKPTIVVVAKPVVREVVEEPPKPVESPAIPLATVLTANGEVPKLKPTPQPDNQPKVFWNRSGLKPVTRQISGGASAPVAQKAEVQKESGPKVMSTVAALRAAIELKNREQQQQHSSTRNDFRSELAELSKGGASATSTHAQKFGGSVKKPEESGPTKKKNPWVGEGMTIKIIET